MKRLTQKITNNQLLFAMTVIFIVAALVVGLVIDFFISDNHSRLTAAIVIGAFLALLILYLLFGYTYKIIVNLQNIHQTQGNLWKLYGNDKLFRTPVNDAVSCLYILINAFLNFVLSFTNFKWYYISVAAIFFVIFIMKLYLILNIGNDKKQQRQVIIWLMIFMSLACAGIVIMLWFNETGFAAKGLMIYWDALYVFVSLTFAIIGVVKAIKSKNRIIGRFLAVKLANAIFGMFTLTVTMIMTFSEDFNELKLMAIIVGICAALLINAIAVAQLFLSKKFAIENQEI